jgi:putative NADH-flavin reductase
MDRRTVMKTGKSMRLFILGATGGIGRQLVSQALERGHNVTAFVRSPQKLGASREGLMVVQGDVVNSQALGTALAGHDAVLSAIGPPGPGRTTITSDCVRATMVAMTATGIRRLVIVGVAMLFDDSGFLGHLLRNTLLRNIAKDSAEMEKIVKAGYLDWTIVRPPRLTDRPRTKRYDISDDRLPLGAGGGGATIGRADVAHFMLEEVEQPAHIQRVVGIAYTVRKKS